MPEENSPTKTSGRNWIGVLGALSMASAVALGAVGAHALKSHLQKSGVDPAAAVETLDRWDVGVRYQVIQSLLLLFASACFERKSRTVTAAVVLSLIAILLFSGGLYAYVLTGNKSFVHIVPIGGISAIAAWVTFAVAWRKGRKTSN